MMNGEAYLSPLGAVKDYFTSLSELKEVSEEEGSRCVALCESVRESGDRLVKVLHHQMQQQNRATEVSHEVMGAFQLGLHRILQLRTELEDLKKTSKELHLADQGLDSRTIGQLPTSSGPASGITTLQSLQGKKLVGGLETSLSGTSAPIPRATSYEDFLRHRDLTLSSSKKTESSAGGSSIRKAKSEPDVATHSLKKRLESLTIDNDRLKENEKVLIKKNIKLTRNCRALEKERDMAEDRLKIEQTQRDSIEKLRQRNKELEEQLRELCDSQVIREREAAAKAGGVDHDSDRPPQPPEE